MNLTITLSEELEQRLKLQSEQMHLSVDEYAVQLLDQNSVLSEKNKQAMALLQSWIDAPGEEMAEQEQIEQSTPFVNDHKIYLPEPNMPIAERNERAIALLQS